MHRLLKAALSAALIIIPVTFLASCQHLRSDAKPAALDLTVKPHHEKPITVWFDATANWERLGSREQVVAMLDKCVEASVDIVVIDVKPISGYVLYDSAYAPRMTEWKGILGDPDFDLLAVAIEEGHKRGLKVFASMNFFAEGHLGSEAAGVPTHGVVFDNPEIREWQSVDYVVLDGEDEARFVPSETGTRGHAIFTSAAKRPAVEYELNILREIASYPLDGICVDRVRWSGITADFSDEARALFEEYLGRPVWHWPQEIMRYERVEQRAEEGLVPDEGERAERGTADEFRRVEGPLYREWLAWRAQVIRDVIEECRQVVKETNPNIIFADYTGAWYPEYYGEGVNWASPDYDASQDYDWAIPEFNKGAFAHLLELLYSGWYYVYVTEDDAVAGGAPHWASMEGTAKLIERVVRGDVPVHGSLFLFQYEDNPELFRQCMRAAYDLSDGLMLFDLVYLERYEWWDEIRKTFPERFVN